MKGASPRLVERFSQYFTLQLALLSRESKPGKGHYVKGSLREAAELWQARTPVAEPAFSGDPQERMSSAAMLTLVLDAPQKAILAHLGRHPYLARADLLVLQKQKDERLLMRQMTPLITGNLVSVFVWEQADHWRERERYVLTESACRFLACRHGRSPTAYLFSKGPDLYPQSAEGLKAQMVHTSGLYRCMRHLLQSGPVLSWKSAREAERWHYDPLTEMVVCIRPDAELLSTTAQGIGSLLIEYDRNTTRGKQLRAKFACYAAYQHYRALPPLLIITQNEKAIRKIRAVLPPSLSTIIVLEEEIAEHGWAALSKEE